MSTPRGCHHQRIPPLHSPHLAISLPWGVTGNILSIIFSPRTLRRYPTWLILLIALLLVGWLDHATGWEWSCFAPYAVPIVLATWKAGRRAGFIFAFLCTLTYLTADWGSNAYHTQWQFALAAAGWCFYFSILVVAVAALTAERELDRARIGALAQSGE